MAYIPKEHEFVFKPIPIGVGYTCEFCNEGELIHDVSIVADPNTPVGSNLFPHKCSNCNRVMWLPKVYPYIEWKKGE